MRTAIIFIAAGLLLPFAACDRGGNDEVKILPVHADVAVPPPSLSSDVFLQKSAMDVTTTDDVVVVDVMLRSTGSQAYSALALDVIFDPGLLQISRIDWASTPLGDCTSSGTCVPLCENNVSPSSADPANTIGDLVIGVALISGCPGATASTATRLMTLWFIATTVGNSDITLKDNGLGDCGILSAGLPVVPGIPCDPASATVTAAR
ncbi:MAG TPA: hypothetical protein VFB49_00790 [Patescibacteria group bacterium]|nr:hypothetical protein [Patescibacteria group bacterium]